MSKDFFIYLIRHYGDAAVFTGLILEYIGFPVPGETMMTFLGYLSGKGLEYAVFISLTASISGAFIGSSLAWLIGRKYGENIILKYGKYVHITKEKLDTTGESFKKHKILLLVFGRYIPGVRHIVPYLAGISGLSAPAFASYNLLSSVIWCISFIGLGYFLGEKWTVVEELIKTYSLILVLLLVFIFVVFKFFNKHKKVIFAVAFPMLIFVKLSEDLIRKELSVFDTSIYHYISMHISDKLTDFMKVISFLGSGLVLVLITASGILVFWKDAKMSYYVRMIAANLLISSVLSELFKIVFHRERPDILRLVEISGFSFPSAHAMIGLSFYGFIAFLFFRNLKSAWKYPVAAIFSILVLSIGISRIYLGVHYASDVLAGFSAGFAWLVVFATLSSRVYLMKFKYV